jgi:capsular polysaccharide biosynthesis protein
VRSLATFLTGTEPQDLFAAGGGRRSYNEEELCEIARRYGVEPVRPEKLTLSEQAALFRSSELIVGASGAAWTNMIFCGEGGAALSWLPANSAGVSSYSTLAGCMNRDMYFLEAHLDAEARSTGEVYTMGYTVDPQAFEAALKRIVGTDDQCEVVGVSAGHNIS